MCLFNITFTPSRVRNNNNSTMLKRLVIFLLIIMLLQSYKLKYLRNNKYYIKNLVNKYSKETVALNSNSNDNNNNNEWSDHLFSVAPMMEYTDKHQRFLFRLLSKKSILYTEMITTNAIVRTDNIERFLQCNFNIENPLVLQFGGNDPKQMKDATKIVYDYGYSNININCGCPSDKVSGSGCFGAILMLNPYLVAELANSITEITNKPPTVKCRIGVNDNDSYNELYNFINIINTNSNVTHFIIHSRKAIINKNFSPHDNRTIPPLNYNYVYKLITDFPHIKFTLNGGINSIADVKNQLDNNKGLCGVMVGRGVVNNPYHWCRIDSTIYGEQDPGLTRREIIYHYSNYVLDEEKKSGKRIRRMLIKPILNLFHGEHNGKLFRNQIDTMMKNNNILVGNIISKASEVIPENILDS